MKIVANVRYHNMKQFCYLDVLYAFKAIIFYTNDYAYLYRKATDRRTTTAGLV